LVDVTGLLLPNVDPGVYRIPAERLRPGDLIVISDNPLTLRYVLAFEPEGEIIGLDPETGDVIEVVPIQMPFLPFFVRIVALLDLFRGGFFPGDFEDSDDEPEPRGPESRRRLGRERTRERFDFDLDEFLLLSLLSGQQPGQTGGSSLLTYFLLMRTFAGDCDAGLLEWLLLSGALQQSPATSGTPQPMQGNLLALLLALQSSKEFGPRRDTYGRRRRRSRREGGPTGPYESPRAEPEPPVGGEEPQRPHEPGPEWTG
jgi:hypothetical protein